MIDWYWYYLGTGSGIFSFMFILWLFDKLGIVEFTFKLKMGNRYKKLWKIR